MEQRLEMQGGGRLFLRQEGSAVLLDARREWNREGIYKVWLRGAAEGKMLLGTLVPEGEMLRLVRRLSVGELERCGCWPVSGAQSVLAFSFGGQDEWHREEHPERWIAEAALRRQLNGNVLCRNSQTGRQLAWLFRSDVPLCLVSLICLAQPTRINGRSYLVWTFDSAGIPRLPEKGCVAETRNENSECT